MDKIVCILLILLLLCIMYYTFDCGCSKGIINGFSVGGQTGPVMCNPNAKPPQNCPGEIPCPQCGKGSCECPVTGCDNKINDLCGSVKGVENECELCTGRNQYPLREAGCDPKQINEFCSGEINPPPPPPGPIPSGDLNCINSNFKGICIDDYSATIDPNSWFGEDASGFKWPLTNDPIKVIRTYNWNNMKNWVIWALKNNIKVLIGITNTDNITTTEKNNLKDNKKNIIGIVYWNEPKYNPSAKANPNILKDVLPNIPSMISYTHKDVNEYDTINDNILAVNIYGLYGNMCCCDGCSESNDQNTLNTQLPWNKGTILINSFDDIFTKNNYFKQNPDMKLWITETGWSTWPQGCYTADCHDQSDPEKFRRKVVWSNETNLSRFYKEFLKYDNSKPKTPEYIFYFCLSDTFGKGGPQPEKFGLYDNSFPPQLKIK